MPGLSSLAARCVWCCYHFSPIIVRSRRRRRCRSVHYLFYALLRESCGVSIVMLSVCHASQLPHPAVWPTLIDPVGCLPDIAVQRSREGRESLELSSEIPSDPQGSLRGITRETWWAGMGFRRVERGVWCALCFTVFTSLAVGMLQQALLS